MGSVETMGRWGKEGHVCQIVSQRCRGGGGVVVVVMLRSQFKSRRLRTASESVTLGRPSVFLFAVCRAIISAAAAHLASRCV